MNEIFIISNDRFYFKKKDFFNSNKNTFSIINCFKKLKKVYLIARISKQKLIFKKKIGNVETISLFKIFKIKDKIKKRKILIISLTPYNFLIFCLLSILGVSKKNMYLFLRSDGFKEYSVKFGKVGEVIYSIMLNLIKKKSIILTCSTSFIGINKSKLIYPSEITDKWLVNRKKQNKKIGLNNRIKLLYLGRLRKEKGFDDLIKLFNQLKIKCSLTIVGNDFKYLKKKDYPSNPNIKIIGQVSSLKKLIYFYNKTDIFVLPSYSEGFPQVILERLSRLKPVVIFSEIKFLKKFFSKGLFVSKRNVKSFEKIIIKIIKDYKNIQLNILKDKIYSLKDFEIKLNEILKKD